MKISCVATDEGIIYEADRGTFLGCASPPGPKRMVVCRKVQCPGPMATVTGDNICPMNGEKTIPWSI